MAVATATQRSKKNQKDENKSRYKHPDIMVGSRVMIRSRERGKLAPKWEGPYTIKEIVPRTNRYRVEKDNCDVMVTPRQFRLI